MGFSGRSTRIRTLDPLVPNQVRYQTAPHSDKLKIIALTVARLAAPPIYLVRNSRRLWTSWADGGGYSLTYS